MQRLLNTVSKTLGVFGVLMLMWTAGEVTAQSPTPIVVTDPPDSAFIHCRPPSSGNTCSGYVCALWTCRTIVATDDTGNRECCY